MYVYLKKKLFSIFSKDIFLMNYLSKLIINENKTFVDKILIKISATQD